MKPASRISAIVLQIGLAVGLSRCGGGVPCRSLSGTELDACLAAEVQEKVQTAPREALELAGRIEDVNQREMALFLVVTESRSIPEPEVRQLCGSFTVTALKDQCEHYLSRPHLRVVPGAQPGAPPLPADVRPQVGIPPEITTENPEVQQGGESGDCASVPQVHQDHCWYAQVVESKGASVSEIQQLLSQMKDPELKGRAVAGMFRTTDVQNMEQVRALSVLTADLQGQWRAEALSLQGSELPFRVLRACTSTPRKDLQCRQLLEAEVLPFATKTCGQAEELQQQCFDHICSGMVELAIASNMQRPMAELPAAITERLAQASAVDPRVTTTKNCGALWAGRKLLQLHQGEVKSAEQGCAAMPETDRPACYSALSEEMWTRLLREQSVSSETELAQMALKGTGFGPLPATVRAYLPCGARAVLERQLASGLRLERLDPQTITKLKAASPNCVW